MRGRPAQRDIQTGAGTAEDTSRAVQKVQTTSRRFPKCCKDLLQPNEPNEQGCVQW